MSSYFTYKTIYFLMLFLDIFVINLIIVTIKSSEILTINNIPNTTKYPTEDKAARPYPLSKLFINIPIKQIIIIKISTK